MSDPDTWMKTETIGGYPWWAYAICVLLVAAPIAVAVISWLAYR